VTSWRFNVDNLDLRDAHLKLFAEYSRIIGGAAGSYLK
jgi:hypothetical protein